MILRCLLVSPLLLAVSVPASSGALPATGAPSEERPTLLGEELSLSDAGGAKVYAPAAAFTSTGEIVLVWESQKDGIMSRRLDREGHSVGGQVLLQTNDLPSPEKLPYEGPAVVRRTPAVIARPDGGALVAWTDEALALKLAIYQEEKRIESSRVLLRRFAPSGEAVGAPVTVDASHGAESEPRLASLSGGETLVVWQVSGGADAGVYARVLGPDLEPRGDAVRVDDLEGRAGTLPSVAAGPANGFLVAWESCCDRGGDGGIFARLYTAPGQPLGSGFPVNVDTTGEQRLPAAAPGPDGGYLVAWLGTPGDGGRTLQVRGRTIGAAGEPANGELTLSSDVGTQATRPAVAADPQGYVVAWSVLGGARIGAFLQRLDAAGAPTDDALQVNARALNLERRIAVASDGEGRSATAWGGFDAAGHPSVNLRLVAEPAPTPPGTGER